MFLSIETNKILIAIGCSIFRHVWLLLKIEIEEKAK